MPFLFGILRETRRRFRMNCNHCKKELNFPKTVLDQLKACPFCGKPLRSINENFKSLGAFIESLVSEYGEDIFDSDHSPDVYDVLKMIPDEKEKECFILRLMADFGITDLLYEARYSVDAEKPAVVQSVKRLSVLLNISSEVAFKIVMALAEALGFNPIDSIRNDQNRAYEKKYYDVLGVSENASQEQIKAAYRKIAMTCHPDHNHDNAKAMKVFVDAQEAYEVLSNPQKRNLFNEQKENLDFANKMCELMSLYPGYSDKFYLLFILPYARRMYDAKNLSSVEKAFLIRDAVNEVHALLGTPISSAWEVVRLIAESFGVKGCISEKGEDLVDDRDGSRYKTIKVGDDVWMAENFRFNVPESRVYKGDETNAPKYGRLYSLADAERCAPKGWHLPSEKEFLALLEYFKTDGAYAYRRINLQNACNLTGFNDLAAGALEYRPRGGFHDLGISSYYWASSLEQGLPGCLKIDEKSARLTKYPVDFNFFSVRYIKDQPGYVAKNVEEYKPEEIVKTSEDEVSVARQEGSPQEKSEKQDLFWAMQLRPSSIQSKHLPLTPVFAFFMFAIYVVVSRQAQDLPWILVISIAWIAASLILYGLFEIKVLRQAILNRVKIPNYEDNILRELAKSESIVKWANESTDKFEIDSTLSDISRKMQKGLYTYVDALFQALTVLLSAGLLVFLIYLGVSWIFSAIVGYFILKLFDLIFKGFAQKMRVAEKQIKVSRIKDIEDIKQIKERILQNVQNKNK